MGASNSMPKTATFDNPHIIEVTPSVVSRLESVKKESRANIGEPDRENCNPITHEPVSPVKSPEVNPNIAINKYIDLEEQEFDKAFNKIENLFCTPVHLLDSVGKEVRQLQRELVQCYRENYGQTLHCAGIAQKYQKRILTAQQKTVLDFLEKGVINDEN